MTAVEVRKEIPKTLNASIELLAKGRPFLLVGTEVAAKIPEGVVLPVTAKLLQAATDCKIGRVGT